MTAVVILTAIYLWSVRWPGDPPRRADRGNMGLFCPMTELARTPSCPKVGSQWDRCGVHYVEPIEGPPSEELRQRSPHWTQPRDLLLRSPTRGCCSLRAAAM